MIFIDILTPCNLVNKLRRIKYDILIASVAASIISGIILIVIFGKVLGY